jgi:phage baseplate assembly protein W
MATSRADRFTQTDKKNQIYSDFLTDLTPHPVSGDVVRFVNEAAVIRSIRNLISTNRGERLYQPTIGSSLSALLFEPMDDSMADLIASAVRETIQNHEPRAKVLEVDAEAFEDENRYIVTITIMVINREEPLTFNVSLTRVR